MLWPREKCLYWEFFWSVFSRILTEYRIWRDTEHLSVFSSNTGKCGPKNSEHGHISSCIGVLSILCIVNELFLTDVWPFLSIISHSTGVVSTLIISFVARGEEPLRSGAVLLIKSVIWESSPSLVFFGDFFWYFFCLFCFRYIRLKVLCLKAYFIENGSYSEEVT